MLPKHILQKLLTRELEEAKKLFPDASFTVENYWKGEAGTPYKVPTAAGYYEVEAVQVVHVKNFKAKGYEKKGSTIVPRLHHNLDIVILRTYPFLSVKTRYSSPIWLIQQSNIFHPNIEPGPEAGPQYRGIIDLPICTKWIYRPTLPNILQKYKNLIENPAYDEPMHIPICLEAAAWFKSRKK